MHPWLLHMKSFVASPARYVAAWRRFHGYGTQTERWSQPESFNTAWDERTALMAAMVAPGSSVLEFGSGREQLEKFLPAGCHYQPSDLVARSPRTLVCNLNEDFPALTQRYDVIVLSGVIEYIRDLDVLFARVRMSAGHCIVSYATTDALDCMTTRLANGWVNHLSCATLVKLFQRNGFTVAAEKVWQQQALFHLM